MPQISPMNWILIVNSVTLMLTAFLCLMPEQKLNQSNKISMPLKHKPLKW